jgi:hypothetical protein
VHPCIKACPKMFVIHYESVFKLTGNNKLKLRKDGISVLKKNKNNSDSPHTLSWVKVQVF